MSTARWILVGLESLIAVLVVLMVIYFYVKDDRDRDP